MHCTTCGILPISSITDRLSSLIGNIDLPCRCRKSRKAQQSSRNDSRFSEKKKPSLTSSRSSLKSTDEESPYHALFYCSSEDHCSFYIDLDDDDDEKDTLVSSVSPMSTSQPPIFPGNGNSAILNEESRGSSASPISLSPPTHDTRRAKYHLKELGTFADQLEQSALRAFPSRGRSRYKQVIAVLIQWGDDPSAIQPETDRLRTIFESNYGFKTQLWLIPSSSSHLKLMSLVLHFLEDYGSSDNLMVVYYGGHGVINSIGQTTWLSKQESISPFLDWTAIQGLFEETESDVLFLLDCCAVATSSGGGGQGVTETIAACGLEPWPPGPERNLFTNALISVLEAWITRSSFTAAMLHSEILAAIKHEIPERRKWTTDQKIIQDRKTPIYILNSNVSTSSSIELASRRNRNSGTISNRASANFSRPALAPSPLNPSHVFSKFDIYNPENLLKTSKTGDLQIPHVLIAIALEEDKNVDIDALYSWIHEIPALSKYAVVEGIYKSFSTALLLSIPLLIWDMLPDDLSVSFVAYIRSRNSLAKDSIRGFSRLVEGVDEPRTNKKEIQQSEEPERQHREQETYSKTVGERRIDQLMRKHTKHPTLESATLTRITNLHDRPQTASSTAYPPNLSTQSTITRPSTSRGLDTDKEPSRHNSPYHFSESPRDQKTIGRRNISAGRNSNRLFDSLGGPLIPRITTPQQSPNERPNTARGPGPNRLYSPLHSNPYIQSQNNSRSDVGQSTQGSTSLDSPFARNTSHSFALEKYIQDYPSPGRPIQQTQSSTTQYDNSTISVQEIIRPLLTERLDRASSRRAAKLDAALTDIFATTSPSNDPAALAKAKKENRRSARMEEFQANALETEKLIHDLRQEAILAREEARRAWDELSRREREERERLAKLRNGGTIEFGKYRVRAVGEIPGMSEKGSKTKAAAILGTILSPREAMKEHRRSRSEPRGKKTSTLAEQRIKLVCPPVPPPKDRRLAEYVNQRREAQQKVSSKRPVAVYQPQLPAHKIPQRKASLGVFRPQPKFKADVPRDGEFPFPDADPNVLRHMTSFESMDQTNLAVIDSNSGATSAMVSGIGSGAGSGVDMKVEEDSCRGRRRKPTTYTFLHEDSELGGKSMRAASFSSGRGEKGKEKQKQKPRRKGSRLVKKQAGGGERGKGVRREDVVFPHLRVQV
ncbi:hypothetical protein HYALB_00000233 [Hymenoscyphus albidus]|uniref:Uncharacterized protein n=1 Tax=Hymenoscyphus albidus TaxID=595503 RepID=A0A9N9LV59_9HELO|nr:hypothetical protein HYALB_00000233 [Hymenoscyphus albidus]